MSTAARNSLVFFLLLFGGGSVYALVVKPRNESGRQRDQVASWSDTWGAARACILGPDVELGPADALALRDVSDDRHLVDSQLRPCLPLVQALDRPGEYLPDDLHAAWKTAEKARNGVSVALASRMAEKKPAPIESLRSRLAVAVVALDDAEAKLRATAGLGVIERRVAGDLAPLPAGEPVKGPGGADFLVEQYEVQPDGLVALGSLDGRSVLVVQRPAKTDARFFGPGVTVGLGDGPAWGLWRDGSGGAVLAGALDEAGNHGAGTVVAKGRGLLPVFALGAGERRIAVVAAEDPETFGLTLTLVRSRDGGRTWPQRRVLDVQPDVSVHTDLVHERLELSWIADSGVEHEMRVDAAALDADPALGAYDDEDPVDPGPLPDDGTSAAVRTARGDVTLAVVGRFALLRNAGTRTFLSWPENVVLVGLTTRGDRVAVVTRDAEGRLLVAPLP